MPAFTILIQNGQTFTVPPPYGIGIYWKYGIPGSLAPELHPGMTSSSNSWAAWRSVWSLYCVILEFEAI